MQWMFFILMIEKHVLKKKEMKKVVVLSEIMLTI
jgi:hypothetical protein